MARLTRDDVLHLAKLARLQLNDAEVVQLQDELGAILDYVKQLDTVDVTDLKPTTQVSGLQNVMRDDEPVDYQVKRDHLLRLAPKTQDEQLKVRRMVE